jgi:hypothetical protein
MFGPLLLSDQLRYFDELYLRVTEAQVTIGSLKAKLIENPTLVFSEEFLKEEDSGL